MREAIIWVVDYVKGLYGSLVTETAKEALTLLIPIIVDLTDGDGQWNEHTRAKAQGLALHALREAGILKGHSSD